MTVAIALLISMMLAMPVGAELVPDVLYVIMDTTHPAYGGVITAARVKHQLVRPGNILSIVLSLDGKKALVKMIGATPSWQVGHLNNAAVIDLFTRAEHTQVIEMLEEDLEWKR